MVATFSLSKRSLYKINILLVLMIALVFFYLSFDCSADTNVSGMISTDTTWTLAKSPYIVTGNVLVNSGATLIIETGVKVKVNNGKSLQIDGTLIARGTSNNPIIFTANSGTTPGDWGYILFSDSSTDAMYDENRNYTGGSILEYCIVEYSGGGLRLDNAHPFINYSTIRYNAASGISAINLTGALKITNNTISNNASSDDGGGIYIATNSNSKVIISKNTINNNTSTDKGGGICAVNPYIYYNEVVISSNTISDNTSSGNVVAQGGGMYIAWGNGLVTVSNNTIRNNSSSGAGGGISTMVYYSTPNSISNNIIRDNTSSDVGGGILTNGDGVVTLSNNIVSTNTSLNGGGGIYAYAHTDGTVTISNNIVSNNTSSGNGGGISASDNDWGTITTTNNSIIRNTAQNNSAISYSSSGRVGTCTYNTIIGNKSTGNANTATVSLNSLFLFGYSNLFGNTATYALYNDTPAGSNQVDARNNWWGTAIELEIQDTIYDFFDDFNKGVVNYAPWETNLRTDVPISPPTGLTTVAETGGILLSWSANTESDIAGYKVYWDTMSQHYANFVDVGNITNYTITGLAPGKYYVTITTYDTSYDPANDEPGTIVNENQTNGNESWYAEEKVLSLPSTSTTWSDVIAKYNDYVKGEVTWAEVIATYQEYVASQ